MFYCHAQRCLNKVVFFLSTFLLTTLLCVNCYAEIHTETALPPEALLQNAIKDGQLDQVRALIEAGVDIKQPYQQGITPLHAAVIHNQENIATVLIQAGAPLDTTDVTTQATPLHLAALYGREAIARLLIQKGANVNATMKFGITPLLVAAQFSQAPIIQLLLEQKDQKVDINHADQDGFTALHFAAQHGNELIIQILADHQANVNLLDKNKATPLAIATENKHPQIIRLLEAYGATL